MFQNIFNKSQDLFEFPPVICYTENALSKLQIKSIGGINTTKNEIKNEYSKYVQKQEDGTIIIPLPVKIEIFWKLCPDGSILNKLPEKNETGDGIIATCLLYSDRVHIPDSLIVKSCAERLRSFQDDTGEDYYNAAQDAALSDALSAAINDIFE